MNILTNNFFNMKIVNYNLWQWILLLGVLLPIAITDIRQKKINVLLCVIGTIPGIIFSLIIGKETITAVLFSLIAGGILLIISIFTRGEIGVGDGPAVIFAGSVLGIKNIITVLLISFTLAAIYSLLLLILKKANRKSRIPFMPFLFSGSVAGGFL